MTYQWNITEQGIASRQFRLICLEIHQKDFYKHNCMGFGSRQQFKLLTCD